MSLQWGKPPQRAASLKNNKIIEWIASWANEEDIILTPGNALVPVMSVEQTKLSEKSNLKEVIYFVLNTDSNAVKIGRTNNIAKRLISLQIANPVKLILLKTI